MYWSAYILEQHRKGLTPEQISASSGFALMTPEYIQKVLVAHRRMTQKKTRLQTINKCKNPRSGSLNDRVHKFVLKIGREKFIEQYRAHQTAQLAEEIGVERRVVLRYYWVYILGHPCVPAMYGKDRNLFDRMEAEGKLRKQAKSAVAKELTGLW